MTALPTSQPDPGRLRRKLQSAVSELPAAELWLLQLLSVIYVPTARDDLIRCIGRCGRSARDLDRSLAKLLKSGIALRQNENFLCHPLLREPLTRSAARDGSFQTLAGAIRETIWRGGGWSEREMTSYEQAVSRLRVSLYQRNHRDCQEILRHCMSLFPEDFEQRHPYVVVALDPFEEEWLATLPPRLTLEILIAVLNHGLRHLENTADAFNLVRKYHDENPGDQLACYLATHWIYRGRPAKARKLLKTAPAEIALPLQGWLECLSGEVAAAEKFFDKAAESGKPLPGLINVFRVLVLLCLEHESDAAALIRLELRKEPNQPHSPFEILEWLRLRRSSAFSDDLPPLPKDALPVSMLFHCLALYWEDAAGLREPGLRERLVDFCRRAEDGGYDWLAAESAELLARTEDQTENLWAGRLAIIRKRCPLPSLAGLFQPLAGWERKLEALLKVRGSVEQDRDLNHECRVAWLISHHPRLDLCELQPVEQRRTTDGGWGKGRRISLQRFYDDPELQEMLDESDRKVCAAVSPVSVGTGRGAKLGYELDYNKALPALVGHQRVFWTDAPEVRVEITAGEPELLAVKEGTTLSVRLEPPVEEGAEVALRREGTSRLRVVQASLAHRRIAAIIGREGLTLPEDALPRAAEVIEKLSHLVAVQSDIGISHTLAEDVVPDERLRLHLMPSGIGLRVELLVQPFGEAGGYYRPGIGAQTLIADIGGKRLRTCRSLAAEIVRVETVLNACPTLKRSEDVEGVWELGDAIDCLEFLVEVQGIEELVVVEWPQGGRMKVRGQTGLSALGVRVRSGQDWFTLEGSLQVDEDTVLDMRRLLEMSRHAKGRFIPLGKDNYLALTDAFRQRLEELRDYTEITEEGARLHPLAALALEGLATEAGSFEADLEWKQILGRLKVTEDRDPPSTLQTELRDYQLTGFRWLTRLASWNMGACLADDMGLGKTIQTLALLLDRAPKGPTLVVAPTSVCFNWIAEAARFAPTVQAVLFGPGDRADTINSAGPFTIVICSYALLQQEEEIIAARRWHTVVLDEAQAIKNAATKRSRAAMSLQSDFRMITTGTPLENHLGELWNLFQFLNPGLLGSLRRFTARFAAPIEKDSDDRARQRLKKLLAPFILRRLKSQVLAELPPRTDIVKHIELSPRETGFYEALRREAVSTLEKERDRPAGQQRIQILAQIMRLRRACCNPKLVDPTAVFDSSKLEEFGEIAQELVENKHKALVFSQFVDHLHILRDYLDSHGLRYQYLDGSTPAGQRKKAVEAFQGGEGDFFLISLKAGGQGLNLTAADYVIHMDPWWNPAVEDQASDRAHRIGQTRPVTIYRLVTRGTIEEKIVELHQRKRNLAESLLEDTDLGGQMSADDLLSLIRDA